MTWVPPIRGNEYVFAALILHKLKQDITEDNVKNMSLIPPYPIEPHIITLNLTSH